MVVTDVSELRLSEQLGNEERALVHKARGLMAALEPTAEDVSAMAELRPGESKVVRTDTSLVQYHVFGQSWEVVIAAHEMRYPTHPDLPLMVSSEVVSRDSSQESEGKEIFTRKVVVRNASVPRMLSALAGGDTMDFEESYLYDRAARRAFKTGKNLTYREGSWGIRLDETMEYVVHRDNPEWTWFRLEAKLSLPSLPGGLGGMAHKMFADLYIDGVGRGRKIDQTLIDEIVQSGRLGTDEFRPWGSQDTATSGGDGEEEAWDSGTETELTSYEDAYEGPFTMASSTKMREEASSIELATVVAELRELKQVLMEVTRRLHATGVIEAVEANSETAGTPEREAARAELAAASWQWNCCMASVLGAGLVSVWSWRDSKGPRWLLS